LKLGESFLHALHVLGELLYAFCLGRVIVIDVVFGAVRRGMSRPAAIVAFFILPIFFIERFLCGSASSASVPFISAYISAPSTTF
jgi:hypothetical protein